MRRVVITGVGAISPHGLSAAELWKGLREGRSSTTVLTRFESSAFPSRVAGEVAPFKITDYVPKSYRKATKIMSRDIELAVVAADGAVRDAKLATRGIVESSGGKKPDESWLTVDPRRVGCNIGAGLISADLNELSTAMAAAKEPDGTLSLRRWGRSDHPTEPAGMDRLTPLWLLKYLPNMLACHVSIIHDTQGPSNTITCQQASAGLALAEACRTIQRGEADLALVGGCESLIHPMGLMRWTLLNRLNIGANDQPAKACRPLDQAAAGTVIAEGGAVLVMEELAQARARGARIYCEIAGRGESSSASGVSRPDVTGEALAVAMSKALREAAIGPEAVDLVVPPGYGIPEFDQAEVRAIHRVFGSQPRPAIVPMRGGIGDCGAGAQAIDLVAAAIAVAEQIIPPAVNCPQPLDGLDAPREARAGTALRHALVAASSISGQNSVIILRQIG